MKLPNLDPVGVLHVPEGYTRRADPPRRVRLFAAAVLFVFVSVMLTTTVVSLGRYCLTTDGANNAALPADYRAPPGKAVRQIAGR